MHPEIVQRGVLPFGWNKIAIHSISRCVNSVIKSIYQMIRQHHVAVW